MFDSLSVAVKRLTRYPRTCPACKNASSTKFMSEKVLPPPQVAHDITDLERGRWRYYSDGESEFQLFEETWNCPVHGPFTYQDTRRC